MTIKNHETLAAMVAGLGIDLPHETTRGRASAEIEQGLAPVANKNPVNPFASLFPDLVSGTPIIAAAEATAGGSVTIGLDDITHVMILPGATGSGKTTLILTMLSQFLDRHSQIVRELCSGHADDP